MICRVSRRTERSHGRGIANAQARPPSVTGRADAGCSQEYGEIAALPGAFNEYVQGIFTGANPPDPHDVSEALVKLLATPDGKRPNRVVVGAPFGADAANAAIQPIQDGLICNIGFDGLMTLRVK